MSQIYKILLVDDDEELRHSLAEQLDLYDEFATEQVGTAGEAISAAKTGRHDVVLLDVGLPDMDGREACRVMRRAGVGCPIIMLTALEGEADTILGLDAGANDYVTKPFRLGVLLARLRAHLRQHEHSDDAVFTIGPFTFQPGAKLLIETETGKKTWLTEKEAAILRYLYRARKQAVSRDTLLHEVWGYNPTVTTHTIETHIYRLRQKMEQDPGNPMMLLTKDGGYRLLP